MLVSVCAVFNNMKLFAKFLSLWLIGMIFCESISRIEEIQMQLSLIECQSHLFFIETMPSAMHLALYLEEVIGRVPSKNLLNISSECNDDVKTFDVPSDQDVISFANNWMEEVNNGHEIFLYVPSFDEYNLFELIPSPNETLVYNNYNETVEEDDADDESGVVDEAEVSKNEEDYPDYDLPPVKGCIIRVHTEDESVQMGYNFTDLGMAKALFENSFPEQAYSPFHGLPMIYVPGIISSQLFAQIKNHADISSWARAAILVWLSLSFDTVWNFSSLSHYLRLTIKDDGTSSSNPDLNIDVGNWGHPESVRKFETPRFEKMTRVLESWGYQLGVSLRAAPYDFRKAPDESALFMENFKHLIEETYRLNYNRKVVIFAHSMGNLFSLYFLNRQSQEWKDKYIHTFVCLAAPWHGSTDAVKFFMRGEVDHYLMKYIKSELKSIAVTWKSLLYLLPNENLYSPTFPIIRTPSKNYTVMDFEKLFSDIGHADMIPAYRRVKNLTKSMLPPNVEVHCMYSYYASDANTDHYYEFARDSDFPYGSMQTHYEDGDETVNLESAKACLQWKDKQSQPVYDRGIYHVEHSKLLENENVYRYVKNILFGGI